MAGREASFPATHCGSRTGLVCQRLGLGACREAGERHCLYQAVALDGDAAYAAAEPSDDAALAKALEPIVEAYKRTALAALASENRGNKRWRRRFTSRPMIWFSTSTARRRALRCSGGRL